MDVAPGGRAVFVCDLGLDRVFVHALDRERATLAPWTAAATKPGAGPRQLVGGQGSNTVTVFAIDRETGRLTFTGTSVDVPSPVCIAYGREPDSSKSSR